MKIFKKCLRLISLFLLVISCNKRNDFDKKSKIINQKENTIQNTIKYKLNLPDTVRKNKPYEAILTFESDFDLIAEPLKDTINFRILTFYYFEPLNLPLGDKERELKLRDSIMIPNKEFILKNVKFDSVGEYLFSAMIKDEIMHSYYNKGVRDSVHFSTKEQKILKKVIVIE